MTSSNPTTNPTTGQPYAACRTASGWVNTLADGSCGTGQTRVTFPDLNSMLRAIEGLGPGETLSPNDAGQPGSNSSGDIKPPSIGVSLNPVTLDPGSFFTNPTGSAPGDVANVNLGDIGGYLHKAAEHLTDPAFWKGSGLVLAGGVVLIIGFLMWSGIGQATIEGTAPAQAYRRAQSGGVQNVRQKKEASDGE